FSRAAVANDTDTVDTQERRAAMGAVIIAVDQVIDGLLCFGALAGERAHHLLGDHLHSELEYSFTHLQDHVADESVRDDHVAGAAIDVAPFDVAYELVAERTGVEQGMSLLGEVMPLLCLGTDVHQADRRSLALQNPPREDAPHHAVLEKMR